MAEQKSTRVRMKTIIAGPGVNAQPGQLVVVSEALARALLAGGFADVEIETRVIDTARPRPKRQKPYIDDNPDEPEALPPKGAPYPLGAAETVDTEVFDDVQGEDLEEEDLEEEGDAEAEEEELDEEEEPEAEEEELDEEEEPEAEDEDLEEEEEPEAEDEDLEEEEEPEAEDEDLEEEEEPEAEEEDLEDEDLEEEDLEEEEGPDVQAESSSGQAHDPTLEELGITGETAELLTGAGLVTRSAIEAAGDLTRIKGIGKKTAAAIAARIDAYRTWEYLEPRE